MTELEAAKLQKIIYASYPWIEIDPFRTRVFFRVLESYSFDECSKAVLELLREEYRKYPPTTSDVIRMIKEQRKIESRQNRLPVSYKDETPIDKKSEIVKQMHEAFPNLFKEVA